VAQASDPPPDVTGSPDAPDGHVAEGLERWIAPYFHDSTLWPVLAVAAAIGVTGLAALLLLAALDRNLYAQAALLAVAWMSADAVLRERRARRRLGLAGRSILALWALAAAAALAAWRWGLF
jgi:hypothetical protein